ncbi:MAG: hypothetical protein AMJ69_00945 [Gammaproteobacteria bacterium SG8_47]|nr:MAG: hypothetical protein AMJ69_00945 [Gammaproteobacteria bacterium SG8_47]
MAFAYCERTDPAFWAEPANAVSNLAFLVSAIAAWALYRRTFQLNGPPHWDIMALIGLMAVIGTGSFLWHTVATGWAELADIIPIWLFVNLFLISFLLRVAGLGLGTAALWWFAFQVLDYTTRLVLPAELCNGSVVYFPSLVALVAAATYARRTRRAAAPYLLGGAALLIVSLGFRSVDNAACGALPLGTHFLWHLCNGAVLYLLLLGVMTSVPARATA